MATYTVGGKTIEYNPMSSTKYLDTYNTEKQNIESTADAYRKRLAENLDADKSTINNNYDATAKQNYINYMQNTKRLPSQLSSLGVNGGASESALINLNSNYGNTYNTNENSRNSALNSLQQTYNNDLATYNQEIETSLSEKLAEALKNQAQYDEDRAETELTRFSNTIHRYTTYDGYTQWIKQLQASNDPYKDIKIAMVMQQRAIQFPEGDTSSSGSYYGGYSSGSSGNSGNSGKSGKSSQSGAIKKGANLVTALVNKLTGGSSGSKNSNSNVPTPRNNTVYQKLALGSGTGNYQKDKYGRL